MHLEGKTMIEKLIESYKETKDYSHRKKSLRARLTNLYNKEAVQDCIHSNTITKSKMK